jgi:hypothetical protein
MNKGIIKTMFHSEPINGMRVEGARACVAFPWSLAGINKENICMIFVLQVLDDEI